MSCKHLGFKGNSLCSFVEKVEFRGYLQKTSSRFVFFLAAESSPSMIFWKANQGSLNKHDQKDVDSNHTVNKNKVSFEELGHTSLNARYILFLDADADASVFPKQYWSKPPVTSAEENRGRIFEGGQYYCWHASKRRVESIFFIRRRLLGFMHTSLHIGTEKKITVITESWAGGAITRVGCSTLLEFCKHKEKASTHMFLKIQTTYQWQKKEREY